MADERPELPDIPKSDDPIPFPDPMAMENPIKQLQNSWGLYEHNGYGEIPEWVHERKLSIEDAFEHISEMDIEEIPDWLQYWVLCAQVNLEEDAHPSMKKPHDPYSKNTLESIKRNVHGGGHGKKKNVLDTVVDQLNVVDKMF